MGGLPWWVELWLDTTIVLSIIGAVLCAGSIGWYTVTKWREASLKARQWALALLIMLWAGAEVLIVLNHNNRPVVIGPVRNELRHK